MSEWIYDPQAGCCRKTDGGQAMSDIEDCRKFVENLTRDREEVMRAGSDKIEEIRARHSRDDRWRNTLPQMHEDRATLLAEVDRLRAEIERLKQEPELLRAELISLANAARKALADAYDRAREVRDAFQQKGP